MVRLTIPRTVNNIHREEPTRNLNLFTSDDPEPMILQEELESSSKKLGDHGDGKAP